MYALTKLLHHKMANCEVMRLHIHLKNPVIIYASINILYIIMDYLGIKFST